MMKIQNNFGIKAPDLSQVRSSEARARRELRLLAEVVDELTPRGHPPDAQRVAERFNELRARGFWTATDAARAIRVVAHADAVTKKQREKLREQGITK